MFDVAVIGGGFTGLSAALACAERGFSVILIEREHIGFGASGRNGGQLIPGLRWSASELEAEFGRDRADALFDLCWRDNRVAARIAKHGIDCDLKSGHLEAAWTPKDFDAMRREADYLAKRFGYQSDVVAKADMREPYRQPALSRRHLRPAGRPFPSAELCARSSESGRSGGCLHLGRSARLRDY